MAICFHRIGYVNRRSGRSSALACGYITGTKQTDERTGVTRDYRNKGEQVTHTGHIAPDDAPTWAKSYEVWNHLECHVDQVIEKRYTRDETIEHAKKTARVSQTHIFALPIELGSEDYHDLAKRFIEEHFTADKLVASYGIHEDEGNPHLHIQNALHQIDHNGFHDTKYRVLYDKDTAKKWRYAFAEMCNERLAERGFTQRIDPRSYTERELDLESQIHEGWYARKCAEQGDYARVVEANKEIRETNKEKILLNTSIILKELVQTHATFSAFDALSHVQKRMADDPIHAAFVYEQILKEAVIVGQNLEGVARYATTNYLKIETEVLAHTEQLLTSNHTLSILPHVVQRTLGELLNSTSQTRPFTLNDEQQNAIKTLCESTQASVLVGRAGTGKTSSLKCVVDLHKTAGFNVVGMALAAEAARHLGDDAGIESHTIASFEQRWKNRDACQQTLLKDTLHLKTRYELEAKIKRLEAFDIKANTLVLVDEAGMVGTESMHRIIKRIIEVGAKVIFIGDDRQFKAIAAGDIFRKMVEEARPNNRLSTLTSVVRQTEPWMRKASEALSECDASRALDAYYQKGHIHPISTKEELALHIAERYVDNVLTHKNPNGLVITFTNDDCARLNAEIRSSLQIKGKINAINHPINGQSYAVNDQIIFLRNQPKKAANQAHDPILITKQTGFTNKSFRVKNGTKGTLTQIIPIYADNRYLRKELHPSEPIDYRLIVTIEHNGTTFEANFLASEYNHFQHGYAITLYKAQGQTVDWSMVYATKHMDSMASYVAMTRHRKQLDIYYNHQEFPTFQSLCQNLNRLHTKDLAADYDPVQEHESINDIVQSYFHIGKEMTLALKSGDTEAYIDFKEDRIIFAKEILDHFESYGSVILQAGLTKANLEIAAGLRERTLSQLEEKLLITLEQYIDVALECRTLWHTIRSTNPGVYAKDHSRYAAFQEKQRERGSLAEVLSTHAPITRTFGKELYASTGYGFRAIQKQALAFDKERRQNEHLKSLSLDDQELLHLYKKAEQYLRFSSQLYAEQRAVDKPLVHAIAQKGKALFKTRVSIDKIQEKEKIDMLANGLCHALTATPHTVKKLKRLLTDVGMNADLETVIHKGTVYERHHLIHSALHKDIPYEQDLHTMLKEYPSLNRHHENSFFNLNAAKTRLAQYGSARALMELIDKEKKDGQKAITKAVILKTFGFDGLKEIYAAARHADRLDVNPIFVKENLQQEIYHLMAYSDAQAKANTRWGAVKTEAEQKGISFAQTSSYAAYQQACMERDCLAHKRLTETSLTRLKQANALLTANHLSIRLDRIEHEASEGELHHACLMLKNKTASKHHQSAAVETLVTALALDETRFKAHAIMRTHHLTQLTLQHHQMSSASDAFPHHKEAIEGYVHAVNGYKSAFRIFLSTHGHDWAQLKANNGEALAVKEATRQRNEAAFHLRGLIQHHGTSPAFHQLLEPLKTTKDQLLHQSDCHESLSIAKAFNASTTTAHKAERGYQLLERFVLETGTNSNRSAAYALRDENITLKDLSRNVQSDIHLNASNTFNRGLFDYKQNVIAFGTAYQTLMDEFENAKQTNAQKGNPKEPKTFISHMTSYSNFWENRMRLAEKAYDLIHNSPEQIAEFISAQTLHKMGGYAHIHETSLLIKGYLAAKAQHDPLAPHIAAEILGIMDFEAHEAHTNPKAPLAYGIRPALFHFEIDCRQLTRDGTTLHSPHPIRARDIRYLFDKQAKPPAEIAHLIKSTTRLNETPDKASHAIMKSSVTVQPDRQHTPVETMFTPASYHAQKQQRKRPEIAPAEFKAFTKEVKQHLTQNIERVAVSLLGQPKEKARNGIWKWSEGVRLHTRTSTRVPRGTFKIYAEGTENMDVFAMIKRTHNVTHHWDAVQIGANLCDLSFKPLDRTHPKNQTPKAIPLTVTAKEQQETKDEWKPIYPVPRDREYVNIETHKGLSFIRKEAGIETMRFAYRDSSNRLLGYVVRLEDEQGKKQTLPLTYCTNGKGKATWKWKGFGDKTPLYGLDRLAKHPDKPVLLVEGEKAAHAAQKQFPHLVVMSWVGGSAGVHKIHLNPLYNKTVLMWPDNDEPGFKAAHALEERFIANAMGENRPNTFAIIDIPRDHLPQKWDLADTLPKSLTAKDVHTHIEQALHTIQQNITTFHIEQEKKETLQKTNQVYEKIFSYEEITHCAEHENLSFVMELEQIPLILHTANETYKELNEWHAIHKNKPDVEKDKRQAMLTGLYTAWAHDKEQSHDVKQACKKAEQIGALAGRLHCEQPNKTAPHAVLRKAEKEVTDFEQQVITHQQNQPHKESIAAHIESEIWHTSHQSQSLTGKAMPLDLAKEIGKHLQGPYHGVERATEHAHAHNIKSHVIRSAIKHMVTQKAEKNEIKTITHEEAVAVHAQHEMHRQQCMQQHHEQMKHIEQHRMFQRQHSRGMEL